MKILQYDEESSAVIDKLFNKKDADYRKLWLTGYSNIDKFDFTKDAPISTFLNNEFIIFSHYSC